MKKGTIIMQKNFEDLCVYECKCKMCNKENFENNKLKKIKKEIKEKIKEWEKKDRTDTGYFFTIKEISNVKITELEWMFDEIEQIESDIKWNV